MSPGPNDAGATPSEKVIPLESGEARAFLSDLRLEELVAHHDRILAELRAPDPLVEAYASGSSSAGGAIGAQPDQEPGSRAPARVGSLQELRAHLDHADRLEQIEYRRQVLLATMLEEGMPLDVWVLTGDDRYVRLERLEVLEHGRKSTEPTPPGPAPEEPTGETKAQETETDVWRTAHPSWRPSPPLPREYPADRPEDALEAREDGTYAYDASHLFVASGGGGHKDEGSENSQSGHNRPNARLLFYAVRKEALDGLPPGVPAEEVEAVSHRIEHFESLPLARRFGQISYGFVAFIALAAIWLLSTVFSSFFSLAQAFLVVLLPLILVAAGFFLDSGITGPRAIFEHKRSLIERHKNKDKKNAEGET